MKIYRAIKTNRFSQGFDCLEGMKKFYADLGMTNHGGYDWAARIGEPVYWDCDLEGTILNTEIDYMGGLGINIITEENGIILKHRFWHLSGFFISAGQKVKTGDAIGFAGNTGASTGPHLHRDAKRMLIKENGNYDIVDWNNGTFGTIRLDEFMEDKFVLDMVGRPRIMETLRILIIAFIQKMIGQRSQT
ncbi:MAG: M23 family metallopeptidase [Candidatus Pacebacteria bacterium]|nr:M23 family metallopeptidase [Candidatus Paceibacterota bacterium]